MYFEQKRHFFLIFILFTSLTTIGQSLPKYAALVAGKESGHMLRDAFINQKGVSGMRQLTPNHWEEILIDSFRIIALHDSSVIFKYENSGQHFNRTLLLKFKDLRVKDKIIIYDIYGRDYGNKKVFVRPLEFILD